MDIKQQAFRFLRSLLTILSNWINFVNSISGESLLLVVTLNYVSPEKNSLHLFLYNWVFPQINWKPRVIEKLPFSIISLCFLKCSQRDNFRVLNTKKSKLTDFVRNNCICHATNNSIMASLLYVFSSFSARKEYEKYISLLFIFSEYIICQFISTYYLAHDFHKWIVLINDSFTNVIYFSIAFAIGNVIGLAIFFCGVNRNRNCNHRNGCTIHAWT